MKDFWKYLWGVSMVLTMSACSTQKNTPATRSFHQTKVKYNIYFNGNTAFEQGQKTIRDAHTDDFSQIIPLYPVSDHQAAEASRASMETTIEKCRKCIKLHSIKSRPKPDSRKMSDPKYKAWLKQEEFNNQMPKVWVRLGEAEFHKGDFLGSIGTFNYVIKHFDYDKDVVAVCQLWIARAYAEMGWLYEAEDMLHRVEIDNLSRKHESLYAAASADVLLKTGHYKEAIPFVKSALPYEKKQVYRPRFYYVLAQLYEREGRKAEARDQYKRVIRMTPGADMEFHARLKAAELNGSIKELSQLAKMAKYKDKLDQIYGMIGNVYLAQGDTAQALKQYQLAIESSTMAGPDKGAVLLRAGDLYYQRRDYVAAQPCYQEALTILSAESEDYRRISRRSETLDELIREYSVVQLQDSLVHLASLSEEEQRAVADSIVSRLLRSEKEAEEAALQADRDARNGGLQSVNTANMIGGSGQAAAWYFYNPQLLRQGKQDFRRKWGNRSLEDHWRRMSKSVSAGSMEDGAQEEETDEELNETTDSLSTEKNALTTDIHSPEFYLQQIPKTEHELHICDSLTADALFNLLFIYQDKVCDTLMAQHTYEEFARRYPTDARLADLYYMYYLDALKHGKTTDAEHYRQKILAEYPSSKQAMIVADPNYFERLQHMAEEQDSLYEATYKAYRAGDFRTVQNNRQYAEREYPLSPLMPRFLFLNAVATARTEGQTAFVESLREMVNRYPDSEMSAMGKSMLAMMGEGLESQKGGRLGGVEEQRELAQDISIEEDSVRMLTYSAERKGSSYVLLYIPHGDEQILNRVLYEVALFNFSQFMIKDFDLQQLQPFAEGVALRISGLESLDETNWYVSLMQRSEELKAVLESCSAQVIQITQENFKIMQKKNEIEEYKHFFEQ